MQELHDLIAFIRSHELIAYFIANAIISTMPEPKPGSFLYLWAYRALHMFAGNVKELVDFNSPPAGTVSVSDTRIHEERAVAAPAVQPVTPTKIGS